jgi:hypothetical protein
MLRNTIIATAAAVALFAGAAEAQSNGPVLTGGGDDQVLQYDGAAVPRGNVVGGGVATITGGGDNRVITYSHRIAPEPGAVATLRGGAEDRTITYAPTGGATGALAGRVPGPRG